MRIVELQADPRVEFLIYKEGKGYKKEKFLAHSRTTKEV